MENKSSYSQEDINQVTLTDKLLFKNKILSYKEATAHISTKSFQENRTSSLAGFELEMKKNKIDPSSPWMTAKQMATYLHTSVAEIYNKVSQGKIPHYKFYGKLLFQKADIDQLILNQRRGPICKDDQ